jgi:hypothetical protein
VLLLPGAELWQRFEDKLAVKETKFNDLDEHTDWKGVLTACDFDVFDMGRLLKQIKAKKLSTGVARLLVCVALMLP